MCLIRAQRWNFSFDVMEPLVVETVVEVVDAEDSMLANEEDDWSSSVVSLLELFSSLLLLVFVFCWLLWLLLLMIFSMAFLMPSVLVVPKVDTLPTVLLPQLLLRLILSLPSHSSSKLSFIPTVAGVEGLLGGTYAFFLGDNDNDDDFTRMPENRYEGFFNIPRILRRDFCGDFVGVLGCGGVGIVDAAAFPFEGVLNRVVGGGVLGGGWAALAALLLLLLGDLLLFCFPPLPFPKWMNCGKRRTEE